MMTQQMLQVLDMHSLINKRPFYSIVVPCYNSRETLGRLLGSLITQGLQKDDLEVILSDDCSTESYEDIVDAFRDKLNIIQVKTDYNCCPGNTRERGAIQATGQWLCFADHDDFFISNCLGELKKNIIENNYCTIVVTEFYKKHPSEDLFKKMPNNIGWTHGKFFNLDNFWKKYNIHYPKDLMSNQDICVCIQASFIEKYFKEKYYEIEIPTYIWIENPFSLSNKDIIIDGQARTYLDAYFIDYLAATAGTFYKMYKWYPNPDKETADYAIGGIRDVILYGYYYFEDGRHKNPNYLNKNCQEIKKYLKILKEEFGMSIDDIVDFYVKNEDYYKEMYTIVLTQIEIFLFEKSFKQWLDWIWDEKFYER